MTFHMPDSWYDPPEPCCEDEDCTCAEDAEDLRDSALIARADAKEGR